MFPRVQASICKAEYSGNSVLLKPSPLPDVLVLFGPLALGAPQRVPFWRWKTVAVRIP